MYNQPDQIIRHYSTEAHAEQVTKETNKITEITM
jgi:hypothetical protein